MERSGFNSKASQGEKQTRIEVVADWTYADIPNPAFQRLMAVLFKERNDEAEEAINGKPDE
jgi:hypothetical protein